MEEVTDHNPLMGSINEDKVVIDDDVNDAKYPEETAAGSVL